MFRAPARAVRPFFLRAGVLWMRGRVAAAHRPLAGEVARLAWFQLPRVYIPCIRLAGLTFFRRLAKFWWRGVSSSGLQRMWVRFLRPTVTVKFTQNFTLSDSLGQLRWTKLADPALNIDQSQRLSTSTLEPHRCSSVHRRQVVGCLTTEGQILTTCDPSSPLWVKKLPCVRHCRHTNWPGCS